MFERPKIFIGRTYFHPSNGGVYASYLIRIQEMEKFILKDNYCYKTPSGQEIFHFFFWILNGLKRLERQGIFC